MRRRQLTLGGLVAAALAAALAFGGLLADSPSAPASTPRPDVAAAELLQGFSAGDTAAYVAQLERRVADDSGDGRSLTLLGLAYQQRARETGDPSFYGRSETALRRALALAPDDHLATTGLAALAASRHRFGEAASLARRAVRLAPGAAVPYGILGDALAERGRYAAAFAAFDRMAAIKPNLASYARVAYARELLGDVDGARAALRLAVEAGSAVPEHAAWAFVQLGNLEFGSGRLRAAERAYRDALARFPVYVHAEAGLAWVETARGDVDKAIARLRRVVARVPIPEFAVALGDVAHGSGRDAPAREADRLVAVLNRVLAANGVRTELETAVYDLDRGVRLDSALARAREAFRRAPSVHAEDALAWALLRNGRCEEARPHSIRALRLGTRSALFLFHRGMIERCLGNAVTGERFLAEALATNPHFSSRWAPVAREALR
jgi:tetratricopeptide (TPR) repeat protein